VVEVFADEAMSGATHLRPEFQRMQQMAMNGQFDVIVAEGLDRLSRDQEHIAGLHKRMTYLGVSIVTKSEGEISEIHIGLGGTMSALFLRQLAQKTHRGLEGRVKAGKSAGGISYGYRKDRQFRADGTFAAGERVIDPQEAAVILRIFKDYVGGKSARSIAIDLNREGIAPPRTGKGAGTWSFSTISGNWKRGTGILNNELYIGKLVWNRQRFVKDPDTGKRQARQNPRDAWVIEDVPALRIVTDDIWQSVKKRQGAIRDEMFSAREEGPSQTNPLNTAKRPTHLLSGLLKCGCCGAGYTMMNKDKYGCSGARNRGTCENRRLIHRVEVEDRVLGGLRDKLMHPALLAEFISEYQRAWNEACRARNSARQTAQSELRQVLTQIDAVITAITEGMYHPSMKGKMDSLEARKAGLEAQLGDRDQSLQPIRLHPGLADVYRQKITALSQSLNDATTRLESAILLRGLITQIRLVPDETASGGHLIEIFGELGAILSLSGITGADINRLANSQSVSMVAGAGFGEAPTIDIAA
jgi:site-specific DNA recombinase